MQRPAYLLPILAFALSACSETGTPVDVHAPAASSAAHDPGGTATYQVTITNLTSGQPLTPPLAVTHRPAIRLFRMGRPAGMALQEIAENGNLGPMLDLLGDSRQVNEAVVAGDPPGPLLPGASVSLEIESARGAQRLSFVSMLICTNDGFTALNAGRLPQMIGETVSFNANSYDAGTEINTEDFADLVPPCPGLTGVDTDDPGTGASDPALAENGVVRPHGGIVGGSDLDPAIHDWSDPVALVEVTRIL